jgi:hypothetical protein
MSSSSRGGVHADAAIDLIGPSTSLVVSEVRIFSIRGGDPASEVRMLVFQKKE